MVYLFWGYSSHHWRTGTQWHIYPSLGLANILADFIEKVSHVMGPRQVSERDYQDIADAADVHLPVLKPFNSNQVVGEQQLNTMHPVYNQRGTSHTAMTLVCGL